MEIEKPKTYKEQLVKELKEEGLSDKQAKSFSEKYNTWNLCCLFLFLMGSITYFIIRIILY